MNTGNSTIAALQREVRAIALLRARGRGLLWTVLGGVWVVAAGDGLEGRIFPATSRPVPRKADTVQRLRHTVPWRSRSDVSDERTVTG
jgi:hypothetical protein